MNFFMLKLKIDKFLFFVKPELNQGKREGIINNPPHINGLPFEHFRKVYLTLNKMHNNKKHDKQYREALVCDRYFPKFYSEGVSQELGNRIGQAQKNTLGYVKSHINVADSEKYPGISNQHKCC